MNSKIVLTLFIAFIMIASIIGFMWSSDSEDDTFEILEYNNHEFKSINGRYLLEINNNEYIFDNSPYDVGNVEFEDFNLESDKYYIMFNPNEKDLNLEYSIQKLYLVLNSLDINVQLACSREEGCDDSLPIKNCDDYAFYFVKGGNTKVYKDFNCIVIQGNNEGISKAVDKVNYNILDI